MKKLLLILLVAMLALPSVARDIEYTYEGQTLTYTVIDEDAKTVETKAGYVSAGNNVSGDLVIPSQIKDGDEVYDVVSIGEYAFQDCSGLTSITIPESVTEIGRYTFRGCIGLTSIIIPESVTEISEGTFAECNGLTSITIPESVTKIGRAAFQDCRGLTSITIPESVTYIGNQAFYGCSGLTSITIPEAVTEIGMLAFQDCSGLNTVILPMKLETIGSEAFKGCSNLQNVIYTGLSPVEGTSDVFDSNVYEDATLYVPSGRQALFMEVSPWKFFSNLTDAAYNGIDNVIADFNENAPYEVFNLNGVKISDTTDNLPAGIYILRQGNKMKKIAVN